MNLPSDSNAPLRVLCLEDSPDDAELVRQNLEDGGLDVAMDVALDRATFDSLLSAADYDIILADYALPGFDAFGALQLAQARCSETPFVCVSGVIGEAETVELLKAGADDCVLKGRLERLPFAVRRAVHYRAQLRALRESETHFAALYHEAPLGYQSLDADGRLLDVNEAWIEALGYEREEVVGKWFGDFLAPEFVDAFRQRFPLFKERGSIRSEFEMVRKDGERRTVAFEGRVSHMPDGSFRQTHCILSDITEQEHAKTELQERERMLDTLMGNVPGMVYRCANDPKWTMLFVSAGSEELTGYSPEELLGDAVVAYGHLVDPEDAGKLWDDIEAAIDADAPWTCVYRIVDAAGESRWVRERGVAVKGDAGEVKFLEGFIQDITEHQQARTQLRAAADEWRATFDAMSDPVAVFDREGRVMRCNAATTVLSGRAFEDIIGRPCYEIFHGTHDYHPACPQQRAFESGRVESSTFEQDDRWLRVTFSPRFDDAGAVVGGVHVVTDVTELRRAEQDLRESVVRQERISEGVIAALSRSVEVRDPYTAGHERRVAQLGAAIAKGLRLDDRLVQRVRVAGMLHDVGKITVPAEILARPGRLTDMEFALIKGHPEAAYEILKAIEFDFPLAEIVLQHHERLDGSGYPRGLTDDEILPEARILAVADVAEAMISHRPYRAALPLEVAMAELEEGAGSRYDRDACEAALRLFREQGFAFAD